MPSIQSEHVIKFDADTAKAKGGVQTLIAMFKQMGIEVRAVGEDGVQVLGADLENVKSILGKIDVTAKESLGQAAAGTDKARKSAKEYGAELDQEVAKLRLLARATDLRSQSSIALFDKESERVGALVEKYGENTNAAKKYEALMISMDKRQDAFDNKFSAATNSVFSGFGQMTAGAGNFSSAVNGLGTGIAGLAEAFAPQGILLGAVVFATTQIVTLFNEASEEIRKKQEEEMQKLVEFAQRAPSAGRRAFEKTDGKEFEALKAERARIQAQIDALRKSTSSTIGTATGGGAPANITQINALKSRLEDTNERFSQLQFADTETQRFLRESRTKEQLDALVTEISDRYSQAASKIQQLPAQIVAARRAGNGALAKELGSQLAAARADRQSAIGDVAAKLPEEQRKDFNKKYIAEARQADDVRNQQRVADAQYAGEQGKQARERNRQLEIGYQQTRLQAAAERDVLTLRIAQKAPLEIQALQAQQALAATEAQIQKQFQLRDANGNAIALNARQQAQQAELLRIARETYALKVRENEAEREKEARNSRLVLLQQGRTAQEQLAARRAEIAQRYDEQIKNTADPRAKDNLANARDAEMARAERDYQRQLEQASIDASKSSPRRDVQRDSELRALELELQAKRDLYADNAALLAQIDEDGNRKRQEINDKYAAGRRLADITLKQSTIESTQATIEAVLTGQARSGKELLKMWLDPYATKLKAMGIADVKEGTSLLFSPNPKDRALAGGKFLAAAGEFAGAAEISRLAGSGGGGGSSAGGGGGGASNGAGDGRVGRSEAGALGSGVGGSVTKLEIVVRRENADGKEISRERREINRLNDRSTPEFITI